MRVLSPFSMVLIGSVVTINLAVSGQTRALRAPLKLSAQSPAIHYGDDHMTGQAVFFRAVPAVVEVGVLNRDSKAVMAAELDWPARVRVTLRKGGRFDTNPEPSVELRCNPQVVRSQYARVLADRVELDPSGHQFIRCVIDSIAHGLTSGPHTVKAEWSTDITPSFADLRAMTRQPEVLSDVFEFEFREIQSLQDDLDLIYHQAEYAWLSGAYADALRHLTRLFQFDRDSVPGLILLGRIHVSQARCGVAVAAWDRAAAIIEKSVEFPNPWLRRMNNAQRQEEARQLRSQARSFRCKNAPQ
jgi:hypothetical protein